MTLYLKVGRINQLDLDHALHVRKRNLILNFMQGQNHPKVRVQQELENARSVEH